MLKIKLFNQNAEEAGELELNPKIFGVKINPVLVHQAMVAQMANERQVLAHTKGRGEVRGGGRKPWRQKGTGRARHGSSRSPIWKGGGVTFGPTKDRNFKLRINQKMKQKAIHMALSDKVISNNLLILDKLELAEFKTKILNQIINKLRSVIICEKQPEENNKNKINKKNKINSNGKRSILIINDHKDEKVKYSARNLPDIKLINYQNINLVDLLKYKNLILTKGVVEKLEKIYK